MELTRKLSASMRDARLFVLMGGILLSIGAHELFHVMVHWVEIQSIRVFPDSEAIVEIIFTPSAGYSLAIEEALAYAVTMITLLLTALLVNDVNDAFYRKAGDQTLLTKEFKGCYGRHEEQRAHQHLAGLLGIPHAS
jgi:hypothetical protein